MGIIIGKAIFLNDDNNNYNIEYFCEIQNIGYNIIIIVIINCKGA